MPDKELTDAASKTPDPERSLRNLLAFCELNPQYVERLKPDIRSAAVLFSYSQFLANFCMTNPSVLFDSIQKLRLPVVREDVSPGLDDEIGRASGKQDLLRTVRNFKKKVLLLITMRDVLGIADLAETMRELSLLADIIAEKSLAIVRAQMRETYGDPEDDAFSVISVGKLGGQELNFSSDIDLLYVYVAEEGETSGITATGGIAKNRISNHEYYCKLGESLNRFLSMNTEDGFVYRVDLRLRPQGQKGSLAMSLQAYETYYESWGRAWERAVLLRARPIAGDPALGKSFMEMIRPFVYRKYLDFGAVDEIRRMKTRIDDVFRKDDIKRGYGGIREIEFFAHAHQLIYGGREPLLRERDLMLVLHRLLQKNLIGHEDYSALSDNYSFLRTLEHRLQQLDDLQTHSLPSDEKEVRALSRKMGFADKQAFYSELEGRRRVVRQIYDSLFAEKKNGVHRIETSPFFAEEISDSELKGMLGDYPVREKEKAVRNIRLIKDSTYTFQTLRARRLLGEILPEFLTEALTSRDPDSAVNNLQAFPP